MTTVIRLVVRVEQSLVERWARQSNRAAIDNAREATTQCCRRRLERVEVEAYLAGRVVTTGTAGTHADGRRQEVAAATH